MKGVQLEKEYIPEFNDNRELPKEEQIVVECKAHISNLQMGNYKKFIQGDGTISVEYDNKTIMVAHVGNIRNLVDHDGTMIKNGIDLADSTNKLLYPLMTELRNYYLNESELLTQGEN